MKSVTLNDLERCNCIVIVFCVISPKSIDYGADYVTVVKDRPVVRCRIIYLVKTGPRSSPTVSLRQLSFLL